MFVLVFVLGILFVCLGLFYLVAWRKINKNNDKDRHKQIKILITFNYLYTISWNDLMSLIQVIFRYFSDSPFSIPFSI